MSRTASNFPRILIALLCMCGCFFGVMFSYFAISYVSDWWTASRLAKRCQPAAQYWNSINGVELIVVHVPSYSRSITINADVPSKSVAEKVEKEFRELTDSDVNAKWNVRVRNSGGNYEKRPHPYRHLCGMGQLAETVIVFLVAVVFSFGVFIFVLFRPATPQ